jgi:hypothetical protein
MPGSQHTSIEEFVLSSARGLLARSAIIGPNVSAKRRRYASADPLRSTYVRRSSATVTVDCRAVSRSPSSCDRP